MARIERRARGATELSVEDASLLKRLRAGDELAFAELVDLYGASLMRVARLYVPTSATAEEVVQDVWLGLLESLDRFEGRASLKTWIFRILANCARKRAGRDTRDIPFSSLWEPQAPSEPSVDPNRFLASGPGGGGQWHRPPRSWESLPEDRLLSSETRSLIEAAIASLPPAQREVITLRDIEGWSAAEVCNAVGVTDTNQRVLLHRARSRVRRALEDYLGEER